MTVTPRDPRRFILPFAVVGVLLVVVIALSVSVLTAPSPTHAPTATHSLIAATAQPSATPTSAPTATPSPTSTAAPLPSTPPTVTTATLDRTADDGTWKISYAYPQLEEGTTPLAAQINAEIKADVETTATQFSVGPAANPREDGQANTLHGSFTNALLRPRLWSYHLEEEENLGGVHPATTVLTVTYDLSTGQRIGLADVFSDMPAALAILSDKSRQALREQLGTAYDPAIADEGTSATASNFAAWALKENGLEITFQQYQVAPGAIANPVVVIPWADLRQVVNPASPIAALAQPS